MKPIDRRKAIQRMHVKFYKQFRALALKQFKQMQAFYEAEDAEKQIQKMKIHGHHSTTHS